MRVEHYDSAEGHFLGIILLGLQLMYGYNSMSIPCRASFLFPLSYPRPGVTIYYLPASLELGLPEFP